MLDLIFRTSFELTLTIAKIPREKVLSVHFALGVTYFRL